MKKIFSILFIGAIGLTIPLTHAASEVSNSIASSHLFSLSSDPNHVLNYPSQQAEITNNDPIGPDDPTPDTWVIRRAVDVRSTPELGNNIIDRMVKGDTFKTLNASKDGLWAKIEYKNHPSAWIPSKYVDEAPVME